MRILFVNEFAFDFLGGVELHILNLSREFIAAGHEVTLLYRQGTGSADRVHSSGVRLVRRESLMGLGRYLQQNARNYDVCHSHMSRKVYSSSAVILSKASGVPTVFTPHCFYPRTSLWNGVVKVVFDKSLGRIALRRADRVICLTERDESDALARGLSPARSRICPNSIDPEFLDAHEPLDFCAKYKVHRPFLLHVGRFQAHKCIPFLVRRIAEMREMQLVLIGQDDGALREVQELASKLDLNDSIVILRDASTTDLVSAYHQAAAFVMGSRSEGLPTVLLEAMWLGVPVVAPRIGGIPYLLQNGVNGCLYDWNDAPGFYAAVARALADRCRLVAEGRKTVAHGYTWRSNAARLLSIYRDCGAPAVDDYDAKGRVSSAFVKVEE